jgi:hypothetical protein
MPAASRRAGQLPELQRPGHARRAAAAARPGWKETARSQHPPRPGLALVDLDAVRRSDADRRRQSPRPGRAGTGQARPARWWPPATRAGGLQARSRLQKWLSITPDRAGGACPARAWQRQPSGFPAAAVSVPAMPAAVDDGHGPTACRWQSMSRMPGLPRWPAPAGLRCAHPVGPVFPPLRPLRRPSGGACASIGAAGRRRPADAYAGTYRPQGPGMAPCPRCAAGRARPFPAACGRPP